MDRPVLTHGGDWAGYELEYGTLPLDFSSNVSPLGVPAGVQAAMIQAAALADRYPDPLCRTLCSAIAEAEQIPASWCLCGCGSADLIYRAVLATQPRQALITAPTFGEYHAALKLAQCQITEYPLRAENGFVPEQDLADAITEDTDLVFLCEPNNPTGRTTPKPLLLDILRRCRETGALLVADECFGGFLEDPAAHSLLGLLGEYPNLLVLKAFTKLYALAGLRLGYCLCANGPLLEAMGQAGQPWAVSTLAQAAGTAALLEQDYVKQVRALVRRERPWLAGQLTALGCHVIPGEANYLLFSAPRPLLEPLRRRGVLLRGCGNYSGLDSSWYRAAVRTETENRQFIAALRDIIEEGTR